MPPPPSHVDLSVCGKLATTSCCCLVAFDPLGFHREALIRDNRRAVVVVRPSLLLHGSIPVSLGILKDVTFTLSSVDGDGTMSSQVC